MNEKSGKMASQMFTLRLWQEDMGNCRFEIRGTIKHVLTEETIHFREWSYLLTFLQQKMEEEIDKNN